MIQIAQVEQDDVPLVVQMMREYWEENDVLRAFRFDERIATYSVQDAVRDGHTLLMLGYWNNDPASLMWARVCHSMASVDLYATDRLVYVVPQHRDKAFFKKMFTIFEQWWVTRGCSHARLATFGGSNNDGMETFLTSQNYKLSGSTFIKTI